MSREDQDAMDYVRGGEIANNMHAHDDWGATKVAPDPRTDPWVGDAILTTSGVYIVQKRDLRTVDVLRLGFVHSKTKMLVAEWVTMASSDYADLHPAHRPGKVKKHAV